MAANESQDEAVDAEFSYCDYVSTTDVSLNITFLMHRDNYVGKYVTFSRSKRAPDSYI